MLPRNPTCRMRALRLAPALLLAPGASATDLYNLSLQELLAIPVSTASVDAKPTKRQPATITLINRQDIEALGARNLMDILTRVPGAAFGVDVFGVTSLSFRGQWAHEGKVLLLWNDLPLDDMMFGNLNLAEHYPAHLIERVEILRGAGSARYGGNAQLAVIRIYTREASGLALRLSAEQLDAGDSGYQLSANGGWQGEDARLSFNSHLARQGYTNQNWRDDSGQSYPMADATGIDSYSLSLSGNWQQLKAQLLYDYHESQSPQKFGSFTPGEVMKFSSLNASLSYGWQPWDNWTLTPSLYHRQQDDWWIDRDPSVTPFADQRLPAWRNTGNFEVRWQKDALAWLAGIETWHEHGYANSPGGPLNPPRDPNDYFGGSRSIDYHGQAAYSQFDWESGPWLASLGLRYSNHSYAGSSLVPRLVGIYSGDKWNLKLTYGEAFREPDMVTINDSDPSTGGIVPEQTRNIEMELSWGPNESVHGSLAVFDNAIRDPIIYASDLVTNTFAYRNNDTSRTRGIESEWRLHTDRQRWYLTYSAYQVYGEAIAPYAVAADSKAHLGIPNQKLSVNLEYALAPQWLLIPSLTWFSGYHAKSYTPQGLSQMRFDAQSQLNLLLKYQANAWQMSAGLYDATNEGLLLAQPYDSDSPPYPYGGRRLTLAVEYRWD